MFRMLCIVLHFSVFLKATKCIQPLFVDILMQNIGHNYVLFLSTFETKNLFFFQEMLRPIPVALASCTRFFEAMSATRESFAALQKLRVGRFDSSVPRTPARDPSQMLPGVSDCLDSPLSE